jgi:hypothetical protein
MSAANAPCHYTAQEADAWASGHDAACEACDREIERLRAGLEEIRDHWANQYDHPRKEAEMYRGPYGIGVTDGHRACTIIAERVLSNSSHNPGAGAEPATSVRRASGSDQVGRTGGSIPPTGATVADMTKNRKSKA